MKIQFPLILPLANAASLAEVGGKACNLGIMIREGLPVPGGFVITTAAYRAFVAHNHLFERIERAWAEVRPGDAAGFERASTTLRAAFEAGNIPPEILSAIPATPHAVAVRSSATAEDLPDASFAGQQDTYLNVQGPNALLNAVRRCWGSLWTARAMAYRARMGIAPAEVALAVVVQEMAPATSAGVMFTVHPVTGEPGKVVINSTWGLGEALVSGRVDPDTIVVEKTTGRLLSLDIGEKAVMTARMPVGTQEVEVDSFLRELPSVEERQVAALLKLGCTLEALFGGPQDVEWAIVEGLPVLLQSRAVTTVAGAVPGDDHWPGDHGETQPFDFWTQQDMGERWPDPVAPLTWSISEPMNHRIMEGMVAGLKAPCAGKIRWTIRSHGHVYLNEGALLHAYTHGFGMPMKLVLSGLTHAGARPADAERWRFGRVLAHLPFYYRAAVVWERNVGLLEAAFPQIDAWVDAFAARDLSDIPDADLLHEARETWFERLVTHVAYHANATSLAMSSYAQLEGLMARWMKDPSLAQVLAGGLTEVLAAEMVPAIGALARTIQSLGLEKELLENPPEVALSTLRSDPRAEPFLRDLAGFLSRHGHRCMVEAELRFPRWIEAPAPVIEQIANRLRNPSSIGSDQATAWREEATARIDKELGWLRRQVFKRVLLRTQRFARLRDNGQHYMVKLLYPLRHLHAVLGERWAGRGWLRNPDDVFFLVGEELTAVLSGGVASELQARADARRSTYDHWFTQSPPEALDATLQPVAAEAREAHENTLVGIAASRGTVTGTARVVLTPQEASRLQPGDILVTRATDPGWTPVFSVIGGAVIEIGGMLSHGAIVAREYGLPAVINVSHATRRIVDGQTITVDGTNGRVVIHPGA
jgi:pyruvate,water dikinase